MFREFLLASAFLGVVSTAAVAAPAITCGQARADLKVCLTSWALPTGQSGSSLSLQYANGENYTVTDPNYRQESQGVGWTWGSTTVKGVWMELWLRVDTTPTYLPVFPGYPPRAQLYFRTAPGAVFQPVPNTTAFDFGGPVR